MSNSKAGTIYIVKNPHYAVNYYKVGKTSRTAEDRLKDEENPSAFSLEDGSKVIAEYAVFDLDKVEKLIHSDLSEYKIENSQKKEWFKIELNKLKQIITNRINENNYKEFEEPPNNNNLKEAEKNFIENENNSIKLPPEKKKRGNKGNIIFNVIFGFLLFLAGASIYQAIIYPILLFIIIKILFWIFRK